MRDRAPWVISGIVVASLVGAALMPDEDWPSVQIGIVGSVVVLTASLGALAVARRQGNAIGWLLLGVATLVAPGMLATQYANRALVDAPGSLPGGTVAAWFQAWLWIPLIAAFPLLLLLFPTGHPPTRRWRPVGWAAVFMGAAFVVTTAFLPGPFETLPETHNPYGIAAVASLRPIVDAMTPLLLGAVITSVAAIVVRYRRSRGVERQQLKWFVYAAVAAVVLIAANPVANMFAGPGTEASLGGVLSWLLPLLGVTMLPVAIGVSILRYKLYDIDRLISRTLAYAVLTAALVGVYGVVAVILPSLFLANDETPDVLIAAGTLAAAAAFGPLRRRVQSRVDHRFNRARYDAARTIDEFTARLREQVELDSLGTELESLISRTMQPRHVSLWLVQTR